MIVVQRLQINAIKIQAEGRWEGGERTVQMKGESQHAIVMVEELLLGKEEIFLLFVEASSEFTTHSRSTRWSKLKRLLFVLSKSARRVHH